MEIDDDDDDSDKHRPARRRPAKQRQTGLWLLVGGSAVFGIALMIGGMVYVLSKLPQGISKKEPTVQRKTPDSPGGEGNFDDWIRNQQQARRQAARENKDLLLLVAGQDDAATQSAEEVFARETFRKPARQQFVLLLRDSFGRPADRPATADERPPLFEFNAKPALYLADPEGVPYAFGGYQSDPEKVDVARLTKLRELRAKRDTLLAAAADAPPEGKHRAARAALDFLQQNKITSFYATQLAQWLPLARAADPKNAQGDYERFFEADWTAQFRKAFGVDEEAPDRLATSLNDWEKTCKFQDHNRAARLHYYAGIALYQTGEHDRAGIHFRTGRGYKPSDKHLAQELASAAAATRNIHGSGTGFVVASGGYLLTNYHVIKGPGKVLVQLAGEDEPVPAEVIAKDESGDMALLRVTAPPGASLKPLSVVGQRELSRGEEVAALGFPVLGHAVGSRVTLTTGVVSALPEPTNNNFVVFSAKVNPGNSGGPLCDSAGNVVGLVSAKSVSFGAIDSYSMARPAPDLEGFLKLNLKGYQATPTGQKRLTWAEVDRKVSPSVLMILKTQDPGSH